MQQRTKSRSTFPLNSLGDGGEIAVLKEDKYHKYIKNFKLSMHSHTDMSHKHSFTGTVLSLPQNQILP